MKYINVRNFLRTFKEAIKELPLTVTRNGVPLIKVDKPDE